ncbi:hypothetical protein M408DRAFT_142671 [Serendipita vermifera MAFF 305830]|uniref:Transmembrane protein n=1 Tax=Serendipita vermifera MAFF 305830 TaxID=933852 RepID=A0A0C2XHA0_SERVB|nr:hypothetical protein M408DRAFT_142671 [Serendipita vermifera MAFF 305830]
MDFPIDQTGRRPLRLRAGLLACSPLCRSSGTRPIPLSVVEYVRFLVCVRVSIFFLLLSPYTYIYTSSAFVTSPSLPSPTVFRARRFLPFLEHGRAYISDLL